MMPTHLRVCLPALVFLLPACEKKEEEPRKPKREDVVKAAAAERQKVLVFVADLRNVFAWKQGQPSPKDETARSELRRELARRFAGISASDLPQDLQTAWSRMQGVFSALATDSGTVTGADEAAKAMNRALAAHGILDLHF